jgi:hypothetical protein
LALRLGFDAGFFPMSVTQPFEYRDGSENQDRDRISNDFHLVRLHLMDHGPEHDRGGLTAQGPKNSNYTTIKILLDTLIGMIYKYRRSSLVKGGAAMNPFFECARNPWPGAVAIFSLASAARPVASQGSLTSLGNFGRTGKNSEKKEFLTKA